MIQIKETFTKSYFVEYLLRFTRVLPLTRLKLQNFQKIKLFCFCLLMLDQNKYCDIFEILMLFNSLRNPEELLLIPKICGFIHGYLLLYINLWISTGTFYYI